MPFTADGPSAVPAGGAKGDAWRKGALSGPRRSNLGASEILSQPGRQAGRGHFCAPGHDDPAALGEGRGIPASIL